jgi:hypothetical protein
LKGFFMPINFLTTNSKTEKLLLPHQKKTFNK